MIILLGIEFGHKQKLYFRNIYRGEVSFNGINILSSV